MVLGIYEVFQFLPPITDTKFKTVVAVTGYTFLQPSDKLQVAWLKLVKSVKLAACGLSSVIKFSAKLIQCKLSNVKFAMDKQKSH